MSATQSRVRFWVKIVMHYQWLDLIDFDHGMVFKITYLVEW